jgi:MOSC domain-containing protein
LVETDGVDRVEERCIGSRITIGDVRLMVTSRATRCVMVTMRQAGLDAAPEILRAPERENDLCLGIYATVERPGHVAVGAPLSGLTG